MSKQITVYKVVGVLGNHWLASAIIRSDAQCIYWVEEWTMPRPDCGPLTAFKTLEDAARFRAEWCPGARIYKAKAVEKKDLKRGAAVLWSRHHDVYRRGLPPGTVICAKIKLLGRVKAH